MSRARVFAVVCLALFTAAGGASCPQPNPPAPLPTALAADTAPLKLVMEQVNAALDQYQSSRAIGSDTLPALSSAELDFKATTARTIGTTFSLFIFKIGGSHEDDAVKDVTYTYSPHKTGFKALEEQPMLTQELVKTTRGAASALKTSGMLGGLSFSKLTVVIQYGIKWDGNIGANAPISLVTVGLSGDINKNTVQSVKLVFGQ